AAPVAVVADPESAARLPAGCRIPVTDPRLLHLDRSDEEITDADRNGRLRAAHPAYVLFTSGSTGEPKAVTITHAAIVNRLDWMQVRYRISVGDTVLQKTPTTFDVSVWELFWPTVAGARTVLAEPGLHREPSALAELIDAERISVIHFVPAMLDVFLACGTRARLDSLRLVFTSGEALGSASAAAVLSRTGARLHNLYGPTEAAVDVTAAHVTPGSLDGRPVSIGNPTEGNTVHVLDRRLRPVPIGVTGELYLGGVQLARGYHGRPALTAGRFVASPFGPGERLYRTGDLVRWRRTGAAAGAAGVERRGGVGRQNVELEFCGRSDFQIKLRGQRVEPGEIEAALAAHPDVSAVVVVPYDDPRSGPQLVAHVVPAAGSAADARTLRAHLADRVPEHMVPAHILTTDALPLSASGKVDRAALPLPATPVRGDHAVREPATATETAMLGIFRELLGDGVGVDDDFFEHGGNSLTATRVVAAVGERLGARLAVREVFDHRTAAALAALADQRDASQATAEAEPGEP
ncbi:AMP-binding protein, partial [Gordonia sihwensis]|uniref:AMP-binding protein n=1 Tax=Gordonia sihwensis TaxID=173559 RepID=UPI0005F02198